MTTLIVLAAGLATRYGGAKQLEPVGPAGETLFDYAVYDAWRAGCQAVVFVIRDELHDVFDATVRPRWHTRLDTRLAVQRIADAPARFRAGRSKPWGTAQALLAAAPAVDGDVLVCNADDFYGDGAYAALFAALRREADTQFVAGYRLAATLSRHGGVSRAVCRTDSHNLLQRIEERTGIVRRAGCIVDERGERLADEVPVSMNLWAFHSDFLAHLQSAFSDFLETSGSNPDAELRIPDVVNETIAKGRTRVHVIPTAERWFGMTYSADLPQVRAYIAGLVRGGVYPANIFSAE